ncbi:hypothetical protein MNBD_GAMMA07-2713 [hydrothermal vent metagenome]|uniref:Cytochrome c-type biogenesis protein H TPR domain-containing protein n=1 Tax=hydrothermal vent metagenome TaxID=652676 RepID=A0A3B0X128_9ZZZZ
MKHLIPGLINFTAASILAASLTACGGADERKVKYLEKGKAYIEQKNYSKARIEFKNVLQIDPKYAEAYFYMGQLNERKKELSKAFANYKKAIELDPKHIDAKLKLAKIYVVGGTKKYISEANKLINQVRQAEPKNIEAEFVAAIIGYKTGDKAQGVINLEKVVLKDNKLVEGISLLAAFYVAQGDEGKAEKLLIEGAKNNPKSVLLRVTLAKILAKNNKLVEAENYLKQAKEIEPDKYSLQVALASFYATSNQIDKAESVLRESIKQDDEDVQRYLVFIEMLSSRVSVKRANEELENAIKNKPHLYELKFSQVLFYEKLGKRSGAKKILKEIIKQKTFDVEGVKARNMLARILLKEGDLTGATVLINEVISEYPNNNDALLISSKMALINLDALTAINGLRTVVKNNPKNSDASLLLAQAHELNKESGLAENELKKSIEVNPINDKVHINYANYLASKGRVDEAVDVVDKALTYFKNNYDLMNIKLKVIASQNKAKEVLSLLNLMEQTSSNIADVNIYKGQYYLSKGEFSQATKEFEKAYLKSTDKYKPLQLIVKAYMLNKKPEAALKRLNEEITDNNAIANLLIGQIYMVQKKLPDARKKFLQASKAAENWFIPYSNLAATYLSEKNYDKAIAIYLNAINKLKNASPAQMQIAAIHEKQKKYLKAMKVYQSVLSENKSNKLAANNYASLLLDYGNASDVTKALELTKSFEKMPQPALQDTLAWAYVKKGNSLKAIEILKPIVEKAPKIAVFRYHLGYALYEMGDKAAAKSHLEIATTSKQEFSGKAKAQELYKSL